jgi:hypothetical protein
MKKTNYLLAILFLLIGIKSKSQSNVADFENLTLSPESYWDGSDLSGSALATKYFTEFNSGDVMLSNTWIPNWGGYWAGLNIPAFPDFAKVNYAQDDLGRMVLNPDVVVRSRGVMEKCSMCVQSIQAGKLKAKIAGRPVQENDIDAACSSICPAECITFGDLNDTSHRVNKMKDDDRSYLLMEEIGAQPNVYYQTLVRNTDKEA